MEEEGIRLPRGVRRKGKRRRGGEGGKEEGVHKVTESRESLEAEWKEVRSFMDPNPQLRGVSLGRYAPKVETLTGCVELLQTFCCVFHRVCLRKRWTSALRKENFRRQLRLVRDLPRER